MSTSDIISIISIIATFVASAVSIIIAILALKQSSQSLEEAIRPYVVIYTQYTQVRTGHFYIVIKNFGQTAATITKISCNRDLSPYTFNEKNLFDTNKMISLAPNQSICFPLNFDNIFNRDFENIEVQVEYKTANKLYSDCFSLDDSMTNHIFRFRSSDDDTALRTIAYSLQELLEKSL